MAQQSTGTTEARLGEKISRSLLHNLLSYLGLLLALFSLIAIAALIIVELNAGRASPYIGILSYLALSAVLLLGLVLVPIGLMALPHGTSYNAYLVKGSDKTALIDTVDPAMASVLLSRLDELGVESLDYVVANHAEQDHSGSLPLVLARSSKTRAVSTASGKKIIASLLRKVEMLQPVVARGYPTAEDFRALDRLALEISSRHAASDVV